MSERSFGRRAATGLIASCFFAILCAAPSAVFAAGEGDGHIRVGLSYGSSAPASCEISSANGFVLGAFDAGGFREGMPIPAYSTLTVSASGGRTTLHAGGVLVSDDIGTGTCVMPYDYAAGALIHYKGVPYRGGLSFRPNSNNTLNVINRLTVEEYLRGVLNSEMGYGNPGEALKAQAVAARSYTVSRMNAHADDGFDLCASVHCQLYKGYRDEHAETTAAVDGTAGLILYGGGVPVAGNYFKNSGGHTQNSEDVWSTSEPHLRGVPDEYSPEYSWVWRLSFRELRELLAAAGEDPGDISSVSVSARNANGSVRAVRIKGAKGAVTLEKNRIRATLGASNVKSLYFTFGDAPPKPAPAAVHALNDAGVSPLAAGGAHVVSVTGLGFLDMTDVVIQGASERARASDVMAAGGDAAPSAVETVTDGVVTFTGGGYGHGVGMPQDSAIEMANLGYDFRRILTKYFTGVEIR
jgi:stage II sporulation protein D